MSEWANGSANHLSEGSIVCIQQAPYFTSMLLPLRLKLLLNLCLALRFEKQVTYARASHAGMDGARGMS
jgi:hypothetical protein